MTVGLLYIATGKYSIFWKDFYLTAQQYLFPKTEKKFFVFTDLDSVYGENSDRNIIRTHIPHKEWPYNTLLRFEIFDNNKHLFEGCDYLLFFNANTIFTEKINLDEILPNEEDGFLVALSNNDVFDISPNEFTYDRNPDSLAYIPFGEGERYYRGCFNGGRTSEFLTLIKICRERTDKDLQTNVIALWHDESHLNKYLLDKSVKIVGTEYGKAEEWKKPKKAKIIFIDKAKIKELTEFKKLAPKQYSLKRFIRKLMSKITKH